jgi:hypothetical protein
MGRHQENDFTSQPIRKLFTEYEAGRKSSADSSKMQLGATRATKNTTTCLQMLEHTQMQTSKVDGNCVGIMLLL